MKSFMTKQKIMLAIPILIVGVILLYSLITFATGEVLPVWQHFVGIVLFIPLPILFFRNERLCLLATGIYLILGTFGLFAITPGVTRSSLFIRISNIEIGTPFIQWHFVPILLLFCILNFEPIVHSYLDFKERKQGKSNLGDKK